MTNFYGFQKDEIVEFTMDVHVPLDVGVDPYLIRKGEQRRFVRYLESDNTRYCNDEDGCAEIMFDEFTPCEVPVIALARSSQSTS